MAQNGSSKPGTSSGSTHQYQINTDSYTKHLKSFYESWRAHNSDLWASADAISISTPPSSEDLRYLKSSAMNIWLLGYEFPETIMVFTPQQIHFLCSPKKASLLETLKKPTKDAISAEVIFHIKSKNDDGKDLMDEILTAVKSGSGSAKPVIGHIAKEAPEGKLLETWSAKLTGPAYQLVDVTAGLSEILSVKDSVELICVKNAAYLTTAAMKNFYFPQVNTKQNASSIIAFSDLQIVMSYPNPNIGFGYVWCPIIQGSVWQLG